MKHAYCIIAHNEPDLLRTLIKSIDDKRNDIFLLIDKKADFSKFKDIRPQFSNMYFAEPVNIKWGGVSQIEAEYSVFECAFKHGPYLIYHLISGVDLPIKTQDYIHNFIMKHPHTEFLSIQFDDETNHNIELKTRYYHFLIRYARHPNFRIRKIAAYIRSYSIRFQQLIGVKRHYPMKLYKGANWCSITNELLEYILSKKNDVLSMFRHTFCCDEIFRLRCGSPWIAHQAC